VVRDAARGGALLIARCGALGLEPCLAAAADLPGGPATLLEGEPPLPLLERLCSGGQAEACHRAGRVHQAGVLVPGDGGQAQAFYERACAGGRLTACHDLAVLLWAGGGVPVDRPRAITLMRRACEGLVIGACLDLELYGLGAPAARSYRAPGSEKR
jgi:TPR repeat protein